MSGAPLNSLYVAATSAYLALVPFPGSAGLRTTMVLLAAIALVFDRNVVLRGMLAQAPRGPLVAYAAWTALAIASLAWSVDPAYTLGELRAELLYSTLALGVFYAGARDASRWRLWVLVLFATTALALAMKVVQEMLPFMLSRHTAFEQRGPWSTHLLLAAPLTFVLAWPRPWGAALKLWVQVIALAALLYAAWETGNRIVWVAFAVQLLVAALLWRHMPTMPEKRMRELRRLTAVAALAVAAAFALSIVERNERHFGDAAPLTTGLERDLRPQLWSVAWREFRAAPVLGYGFGREVLAPAFIPVTPNVPNHPQMRHGHNVFVDIALQLGVVGLAAFVALLGTLALEYRRFLRDPRIAPLGILGLMLLAGFVVKNQTDDFLHRHNALLFWALNGMLLGLGRNYPLPGPLPEERVNAS